MTHIVSGAGELLRELAGPDMSSSEHQLEAIRDLLDGRSRMLCMQRTGWGKSAPYLIATALLRKQAGPTPIVSPIAGLAHLIEHAVSTRRGAFSPALTPNLDQRRPASQPSNLRVRSASE